MKTTILTSLVVLYVIGLLISIGAFDMKVKSYEIIESKEGYYGVVNYGFLGGKNQLCSDGGYIGLEGVPAYFSSEKEANYAALEYIQLSNAPSKPDIIVKEVKL